MSLPCILWMYLAICSIRARSEIPIMLLVKQVIRAVAISGRSRPLRPGWLLLQLVVDNESHHCCCGDMSHLHPARILLRQAMDLREAHTGLAFHVVALCDTSRVRKTRQCFSTRIAIYDAAVGV